MHRYAFFEFVFQTCTFTFLRSCQLCTSRSPTNLLRTSFWSCASKHSVPPIVHMKYISTKYKILPNGSSSLTNQVSSHSDQVKQDLTQPPFQHVCDLVSVVFVHYQFWHYIDRRHLQKEDPFSVQLQFLLFLLRRAGEPTLLS